jgi:hypothetical protein
MTNQASNPPVDHIRLGAVQAAIWRNLDREGRNRYGVTVEKRYKNGEGDWHSTNSFGRDDLQLLAKAVDTAHTRIFELQAEDREQDNGNAASTGAAKAKSRRRSR